MKVTLINPKQIAIEEEYQGYGLTLQISKIIYHIQEMMCKRSSLLWHPLGLLYIASSLQRHNHDVELVDLNFQRFRDNIDGVIGVSFDGNIDKNFLEMLRKYRSKGNFIIAGGYEATFHYPELLRNEIVDVVVLGEGEITITKLLDKIENRKEWKRIEGITYKNKDKIVVNPPTVIKNLDTLPLPSRELIDIKKYKRDNKWVNLVTSRGCPGICAFCVKFQSYRIQSIKKTIKEMQILYDYGYRHFLFGDNRFAFSKKRMMKLCATFKKYFPDISWWCQTHVSDCNEAMLKVMKESGCIEINLGIESFNQRTLDTIKKDFKITQAEKVFNICRKIGIKTSINLILGLPHESPQLFLTNLIKYSLEFRPNSIGANLLATSYNFSPKKLPKFGSPFQRNPEKFKLRFKYDNNGYYNLPIKFKRLKSVNSIELSSYEKIYPLVLLYCLGWNLGWNGISKLKHRLLPTE